MFLSELANQTGPHEKKLNKTSSSLMRDLIISKENSKLIVENVYYDGNLKLKLLIDFTKWLEGYPQFDRY